MSKEREDFQKTLQEISTGSHTAVWHFIQTYGHHVQRVVRRRMGSQMRSKFDSADFVQMVWASFFRDPSCIRNVESPKQLLNFLAAMARNKVIDQARHRNTSETSGLNTAQDSTRPAQNEMPGFVDYSTPSQYAMARERWQQMMSDPSDRNRRVVQMRMQGASYAEIASRLGIGETTARDILQRLAKSNS